MATLAHHFEEGGWGMYPLVACLLLVVLITIERAHALFRRRARSVALLEEIGTAIRRGDLAMAMAMASAHDDPTARIARVALLHGQDDRELLERAIELQLDREIVPLARRMRAFHAIAVVVMLLGLLGTLSGILESFGACTYEGGSPAPMIARGVAEALHCTALALFVAAYAVAAGAVLHGVAHRITDELSLTAQELRNLMFEHRAEARWRAHEPRAYRH